MKPDMWTSRQNTIVNRNLAEPPTGLFCFSEVKSVSREWA